MGFEVKFNWVLQIECKDALEKGTEYPFSKKGNRVFPLQTPIDLINPEREAVAKVRVIEFRNTEEKTEGRFEVVKVYADEEKRVLTQYWKENV